MRRSEINRILTEAKRFIAGAGFRLPPFAFWTPEQWRHKGHECDEIRMNMLGWDVTDFGLGRFEECGLVLFTLRNGNYGDPLGTKPYAEKLMIVRPGQRTPLHFHWKKIEDIINRSGGILLMRLYRSLADESVDAASPVEVSVDGTRRRFAAGSELALRPGESITVPRRAYHEFWVEEGGSAVLVGEVSSVNDDAADNRFAEPLGRFPAIEEDEPPLHYLCNEYPAAR